MSSGILADIDRAVEEKHNRKLAEGFEFLENIHELFTTGSEKGQLVTLPDCAHNVISRQRLRVLKETHGENNVIVKNAVPIAPKKIGIYIRKVK